MKTVIRRILMVSLFLSSIVIFKSYAGQEGNGGGGVNRHGKLMSFYSAGIRTINSGAQSKSSAPGLEELLNFIDHNEIYTRFDKSKLFSAITPAFNRNYYDIDKSWFTSKEKLRILEEYARVTGQPKEELVLYAVTDTVKRDTFLFPDFYKLPLHDQMAILYHEAQWILNPNEKYVNITNKEIAFQAYLEDPTNILRSIDLALSENYAKVMELAFNSDRNKQLYNDELKAFTFGDQKIPFTILGLAGSDFIQCAKKHVTSYEDYVPCQTLLIQFARKLHMSFPQSAFIYLWYKSAASFNIFYSYSNSPYSDQGYYSKEEVNNILTNNFFQLSSDVNDPTKAYLIIGPVEEEPNPFQSHSRSFQFTFIIKFKNK